MTSDDSTYDSGNNDDNENGYTESNPVADLFLGLLRGYEARRLVIIRVTRPIRGIGVKICIRGLLMVCVVGGHGAARPPAGDERGTK